MAGGKKWTDQENELVRKHYPKHGANWVEWQWILPGRSTTAITNHAQIMGIKTECRHYHGGAIRANGWTGKQRAALLKNAARMKKETGHDIRQCIAELVSFLNGIDSQADGQSSD